ncbi:MAG: MarR family transcriptional regulator [Candidatus Dormibacteria bacterium]|jgi:DNA-binding MarR family transcriptional regulator
MASISLPHVPDAPRTDLLDRLMVVLPQLRRLFARALPADLTQVIGPVTVHQMQALHTVARRGSISMGELAGCLDAASMSTATQMADRLVRLGLVDRSGDPDDRRLVLITLSDRGRRLHEEMEEGWRRGIGDALAGLSDEECATLIGLIERVVTTPMEGEHHSAAARAAATGAATVEPRGEEPG